MPRTWMHGRYSKGWMENLPETHESIGAFLGKIRARVAEPAIQRLPEMVSSPSTA